MAATDKGSSTAAALASPVPLAAPALAKLWQRAPGLLLAVGLMGVASLLADAPWLRASGVSALTLALLGGMLLGNVLPELRHGDCQAGLVFAQKRLLRLGVALYGFSLSGQQLLAVGWSGLAQDLALVLLTLLLGVWLGQRWLGLPRDSALLIAAGTAICGAAAVIAAASVLPGQERERGDKVAMAVATVVLFGTLALFLYPLLFAGLLQPAGWSAAAFGRLTGSSVQEVAQVVAIGQAVGEDALRLAVVTKMLRVALLVPVLWGVGRWWRATERSAAQEDGRMTAAVPWFALGFVVCVLVNSSGVLPLPVLELLRLIGRWCLGLAMAAFGLELTLGLLRRAGSKPLWLGALLAGETLLVSAGLTWWLGR